MNLQKSFTLFWSWVLIFIQFFYFTNPSDIFNMRQGKAVFFIFAVFVSTVFFGLRRSNLPKHYTLIALLPIIALIKLPEVAEWYSIYQIVCFIAGIIFFAQVITIGIDTSVVGNFIAFSCVVQSIWLLANWLGLDPLEMTAVIQRKRGEILGGIGNRGFTGGFIGITLPFLLTRRWKYYIPLAVAALVLVAVYKTTSPLAIGIFSILSGIMWHMFTTRPRINLVLQMAAFFGVLTSFILFIDNIRLQGWLAAINLTNSWYGRGLGWVPARFREYFMVNTRYMAELHNEYLEAIISFGPFALILFYLVVKAVCKPNKTLWRFWTGAMASLLFSFPWHPLHLATPSIVIIIYFGVLLHGRDERIPLL